MTDHLSSAFLELDTLLKNEQYRLAVKKADESEFSYSVCPLIRWH